MGRIWECEFKGKFNFLSQSCNKKKKKISWDIIVSKIFTSYLLLADIFVSDTVTQNPLRLALNKCQIQEREKYRHCEEAQNLAFISGDITCFLKHVIWTPMYVQYKH